MSSADIDELLDQTFSCRAQDECCQSVSGYCCWSNGRRDLGAAARVPCRMPACTRGQIPEAMLMMAMRLGFRHCEVRNDVASTGKVVDEKVPGMTRMSN
jgi:hypothetical protein